MSRQGDRAPRVPLFWHQFYGNWTVEKHGAADPGPGNSTVGHPPDVWWHGMFCLAFDGHGNSATPVTSSSFAVHLHAPASAPGTQPAVESIRYDESAPRNTARQRLDSAAIAFAGGTMTLRVPSFTHCQVLRVGE